ncbi:restriction endonuclease subunit S [Dokdonia genika]|uniref:Restriction endonuclease subunit S n=1 Tax=Dokdonia genika TaxID=308113 RepID=A0ABV9LAV6_9FLAO
MPQNWKTYKLGEVATLQRGFDLPSRKRQHGSFKVIAASGFSTWHNEFKVKGPGVTTGRSGTLGKVFYEADNFWPLNTSLWVKNFHSNNPRYIYYFLQTLNLEAYNSGTSVPTLNRNDVHTIEVKIPELEEQTAIASILSTIDAKIENNLAINKTLEEMAMALYKEWFVDFGPFQDGKFVESELGMIPEGWEVKRLDEVAYKNSKTFNFKNKEKVVFVNTGDVQFGSFLHNNYSDSESLPGQAKKVIEVNDILYSEIRPKNKRYAYVDFDSSDYVVSTKFMIIRNNELINNRLLYRILTRQETVDEFQMIAESRSGTFPQITFDAIGHFPIVLPSIELQDKFQSIVGNYEYQQKNNLTQNQTLTTLRDTLLPKLISGEVRLTEFVNT